MIVKSFRVFFVSYLYTGSWIQQYKYYTTNAFVATTFPIGKVPFRSLQAQFTSQTTMTTTMAANDHMVDDSIFITNYMKRLQLDPQLFIDTSNTNTISTTHTTIDTLRMIQEHHLAYIPFENLSQHGCSYPANVNDMIYDTYHKIIVKKRGGFCFEVNGLLSVLLMKVGYTIARVPAYVYRDDMGFADVPTHMILIVTCPSSNTTIDNNQEQHPISSSSSSWFVDVGFGEPSIHPLQYDDTIFDKVQITPEGMQSKICKDDNGDIILYWWNVSLNMWTPRLKWNYHASLLSGHNSLKISDFVNGLATVHHETSIFAQKMICCRLTRQQKFTVAGNRYKITGPLRFPNISNHDTMTPYTPPVTVRTIDNEDTLRQILHTDFLIPIEATEGIQLKKSMEADPNIWSNQ